MSDTKTYNHLRPKTPIQSTITAATLFLPSTEFPMKAGLPDAEPKWLKRWEEMGLYAQAARRARKARPSTCSTTARLTPMATSISAPRSTRS